MRRGVPGERLEGVHDAQAGLSGPEAESRLRRYGPNMIIPGTGRAWTVTLRDTLRDPMLWFLLATSGLFWIVAQYAEALVLLLALIPLIGMDLWLHRRTQASVQGLSGRLAVQARVVRDGVERALPAEEIVPGDLVMVRSGESFPADGLLVSCDGLQVDESTLTGEAYPVRKQALDALPGAGAQALVADQHWGLAGTRVLTGCAGVRVVFTGAGTLYGEIVRSAIAGVHPLTPLQRAVGQLVRALVVVAGVFCLALAWLRYQQGHGLLDALLSALTLAIAALPEEFPVVLAIFLGAGVYRLARRRALVRRAVVVENIGRVTCICSDKTGTLTEGRLRLTHLQPAPGVSEARLLETAAAASRADSGDPVDQAVLILAPGQPVAALRARFPFTEDRRRETGVWEQAEGLLVAVKGAPEVVLGLCGLSEDAGRDWMERVDEYARSGHKVIACAGCELDAEHWPGGEPDRGLAFIGLLAFEDPVREGVREAVQACRAAGIHVIMVTGDHPRTASAIAREIGLGEGEPRLITGDELAQHTGHGGALTLRAFDVIARAVPAQKLALVRGLQAAGEIVAVTGDGVNDVPALQAADVGIAMGERGSQSAREVASVVLMDDNFRSIAGAVAEGRELFTSLQLSFQYLLMIHMPLVATAALIPMLGYPLLYLPIHIVWLELIIHPTALLVFQNLRSRRPLGPPPAKGARARFFDNMQWMTIVVVGAVVTLLVLGTYIRSLGADYAVDHARTMALLVLIMAGAGITGALSRMRGLMAWVMVVGPPLLSAVFIYTPALRVLLHLHPLHWDDWLIALGGGLLAAVLVIVGVSGKDRRA
ncbi:cation-translocating P-type ATPase [Thioalkalivibrio sulfidiphilus]|uniref:P-type Cu(+) transporter n=1 Tax=Thioalkalivibrio sulfidiphilus (strain HL-EbGR7) TaxID=396588 RepID=B8GTJ2_THISH|nr:cation-transporting P-type ATPase [Thioalkalivibrio sulfidiphilus]ACL71252.1 ATPase, P-type (transporting), HAD superfamily, subfamily IC [Thioalkalivibrio sulfidiphilus HL-EbGr7]